MRVFSIFILALFILSCNSSTEENTQQPIEETQPEEEVQPKVQNNFNIYGKVYDAGALNVLNKDCTFNKDCDCCHDELIINQDKTINFISYCEGDVHLMNGFIEKKGDFFELVFDGHAITKTMEQETLENKVAIFTKKVFATDCNGKIQFVFVDEKTAYYAIETENSYTKAIEEWNRLNSR